MRCHVLLWATAFMILASACDSDAPGAGDSAVHDLTGLEGSTALDSSGDAPGQDAFLDGAGDSIDAGTCTPPATQACKTAYPGVCAPGTQTCTSAGIWGACVATIKPGSQNESCGNSQDDDCDGTIDAQDVDCQFCTPAASQSCTTTHPGVCAAGTQQCTLQEGGSVWEWTTCEATIQPGTQTEVCTATTDEDCDGMAGSSDTDCQKCTPSATQSCTTSFPGICSAGTQTCTLDNTTGIWDWGACVATVQPGSQTESCTTTTDDDCDGAAGSNDTDCQKCTPSATQSCTTSFPGVCAAGTQSCTLDGTTGVWDWSACVATIQPGSQTEVCTATTDEDCDGVAGSNDTDCQKCTPNATQSCTTSFPGVCSAGTQTCTLGGTTGVWDWSTCAATIQPGSQTESCSNSLDDDCDGAADVQDSDCCTDQCTSGNQCNGNDLYACGNCDADPCKDWCFSQTCSLGCSGSSCITCSTTCGAWVSNKKCSGPGSLLIGWGYTQASCKAACEALCAKCADYHAGEQKCECTSTTNQEYHPEKVSALCN